MTRSALFRSTWMRLGILGGFLVAVSCNDDSTTDTRDAVETPSPDAAPDPGGNSDASDVPPMDVPTDPGSDPGVVPTDSGSDPGSAIVDPAPDHSSPGGYDDGTLCPQSDITVFTIDAGTATSYRFQGSVNDATGDGRFYVKGPQGEEIAGTIPTVNGNYDLTIPLFCGTQTVKLVWSNETCQRVVVLEVTRRECTSVDIQVTLTWDALGRDWELHLIRQGGRINDNATDCTWTSCINTSPDWGSPGDESDNPRKDVDNTGAYGPENIYLSRPESGTYTVMVEHWGGGDPESSGQVILNVKQSTVTIPITRLAPRHVRTVATIAWPAGTVTPLDQDYDCTASWSGGCKAEIP